MREKVNLSELEPAIYKSWSRWTSADPSGWTEGNSAWGQCAVTALVVQDFLGGSLLRIDLSQNPNPVISSAKSHYFNKINGQDIDLSRYQFDGGAAYDWVRRHAPEPEERSREYLLSNTNTRTRYRELRFRVAEALSGENPIFRDLIFKKCFLRALESNCQKGQYGCVIKYGGKVIIKTFNSIMDVCKDWSQPVCVRISMDIPSRTESMIGCCSHAEEEALKQIRLQKLDPEGCELYVAGFRSNGLVYIKSEPVFSCLRCAIQIYMHGIGAIFVPCRDGWARMTAEEAVETAKKFALKEKVLENYQSR